MSHCSGKRRRERYEDWTAIYRYTDPDTAEQHFLSVHNTDSQSMNTIELDNVDVRETSDAVTSSFRFNFSFCSHLRKLEKEAIIIQYQLAYLSTLGGAYHLINKPLVALQIAKRQEYVGRRLGSTNLLIRAKVFQAVNLRILGDAAGSDFVFQQCKQLLVTNPWLEDVVKFVEASERWVLTNYGESIVKQIEH